ncbi:glycosyltransferase [Spirosoma panaciterrae]|uniref:glycosyltransferase n=1 Tax=Spirosoma panaciterrae TaxID=496058 RepID=UPI000370B857|nr:glycosyltransferase [Spirosoma panaciterrae]
MKKPLIFWCGSILNYEGLKHYIGESAAATQWSYGLLSALSANNVDIKTYAPIWDSAFPKGKLFPGKSAYLEQSFDQTLVRYLNLPWIRPKSIALSLEKAIESELRKGTRPIAILNYNPLSYYSEALDKISRKYPDIPWVNIVLDLNDPTADNWATFLQTTRRSKGSVFLSWWGYCNAPLENKLHLDAGWSGTLPNTSKSAEKVFIYAGKLEEYGGINQLLEAIKVLPDKDVFFDFYGKRSNAALDKLAAEDSRVRFHGFVPDEQLDEACSKATAFLNPRDLSHHTNNMIFPSKLLFYIKYRKPILGPTMPGISPEYNSLLIQPTDSSPESWVNAIQKTIRLTEKETKKIAAECTKILQRKTWDSQATSLMKFLETIQ